MSEGTSRRPVWLHWVPPENVTDSQTHMVTACGLDIDHPKSLAWTRSTDLPAYQHRAYEHWPPPCPECREATEALTGP